MSESFFELPSFLQILTNPTRCQVARAPEESSKADKSDRKLLVYDFSSNPGVSFSGLFPTQRLQPSIHIPLFRCAPLTKTSPTGGAMSMMFPSVVTGINVTGMGFTITDLMMSASSETTASRFPQFVVPDPSHIKTVRAWTDLLDHSPILGLGLLMFLADPETAQESLELHKHRKEHPLPPLPSSLLIQPDGTFVILNSSF